MRLAFALPLVLACGFAVPALAQPADSHVQTVSDSTSPDSALTPAQRHAKEEEAAAAAALAMSMRAHAIEEARIAHYACLGGDTSKCPAANAAAADRTNDRPSP